MKKVLFPGILLVCLVLLSLTLVSCPSQEGTTTYTLSGSLNKTGILNGRYGSVKLVAQGGLATDTTLYWAKSTEFSGGIATYSIGGIAPGTYTGYAFIDVDGDATWDASAMPDKDDYAAGPSADIVMNADQTQDIPEGAWSLVP